MNEKQRNLVRLLKSLESSQKADYLIEFHPIGSALPGDSIIKHCNWNKSDQMKLARHYLSNIPHATDSSYNQLLSFMSISNFLKIIDENLPTENSRIDLLHYYLSPALKKAAISEREKLQRSVYLIKLQSLLSSS